MPVIVEYSKRFGAYEDLPPLPAMVLGAGETTVVRMVTAYAAFANGGKQVRATLVDRIQDRWGRTVWRHDQRRCDSCKADSWQNQPEPEICRRPPPDHRPAHRLPDDVDAGRRRQSRHRHDRSQVPAHRRRSPARPARPTTSKDVWFVGYSPDLVVGVYVGYDNPKPMGKSATGGAGRGADLRQLHEDGAGRQEGRAVPHAARHQAGVGQQDHRPARQPRRRRRDHRVLQAGRGARRRLVVPRLRAGLVRR